jgi:hypothetical protein
MKLVKLQNLVAKCCKIQKIWPCEICKFSVYLYYVGNCYHFRLKNIMETISARNINIMLVMLL